MKVILRDYGNESYVVKDVIFKQNGTYECEGNSIKETDILTVLEKENDFVTCSACGQLIKNTPKAIREHIARKESYKGCLECQYLKTREKKNQKIKYALNEDGTFHRVLNDDVKLICGASYLYTDITSEERLRNCPYAKCSKETISSNNGFFDKYPNAFDEMITVDAIKFKAIHSSANKTILQLRCRGVINACANKKGIIDWYEIRTRNDSMQVYYSKKYNKLFMRHYGKYKEVTPNCVWSDDKLNYIKKTIANLYV